MKIEQLIELKEKLQEGNLENLPLISDKTFTHKDLEFAFKYCPEYLMDNFINKIIDSFPTNKKSVNLSQNIMELLKDKRFMSIFESRHANKKLNFSLNNLVKLYADKELYDSIIEKFELSDLNKEYIKYSCFAKPEKRQIIDIFKKNDFGVYALDMKSGSLWIYANRFGEARRVLLELRLRYLRDGYISYYASTEITDIAITDAHFKNIKLQSKNKRKVFWVVRSINKEENTYSELAWTFKYLLTGKLKCPDNLKMSIETGYILMHKYGTLSGRIYDLFSSTKVFDGNYDYLNDKEVTKNKQSLRKMKVI